MKHTWMLLLMFLISMYAKAQMGQLQGIVYDEKKQPIIAAVVEIRQGKVIKGGIQTDADGRYFFKSLQPGIYELTARYIGYKTSVISNVTITANLATTLNINMSVNTKELQELVVREYKVPLLKKDKRGTTTAFTGEQPKAVPSRNMNDVASLAGGTYQQSNGSTVSIGGARATGTYIVDGMHITPQAQINTENEQYTKVYENNFMNVKSSPLSTLSVDVDRASYSNIRRFINAGQMPPADAVRIEEMINYFDYQYPQPKDADPIAIVTTLTECPWNSDHQLLHIGMQAKKIDTEKLPPSNLVFLIDVSGSMQDENKLPLVISSLKMLTNQLRAKDRVSIVVYAGNAGLVLPSTSGQQKMTIINALERLSAGGSTAGGAGIKLAYKVAMENFIEGGNNRVILATDGDFNVGVSSDNELEDLITEERKKGIFLTCLGYGMGNYKDSKMETLADKGNGNYAYIDNVEEAQKTLVHEFGGTLFTVAKDVKAQIEFNPTFVESYRLVGYENRLLNAEDFKDDKKDAGDMGSGHQVTIMYEIVPAGTKDRYVRKVDPLKYQVRDLSDFSDELATIKFRYKKPDADRSREIVHAIFNDATDLQSSNDNVRFASSVALFGMLLRQSKFAEEGNYQQVIRLAKSSTDDDQEGYKAEFIKMVKTVNQQLSAK